MIYDDSLYPEAIKSQCDAAIKALEQDNLDIETVQKHLQDFIIDDELVSEAYSALKLQISDYLTVTSAMISANDLDIADMQTLKNSVGKDELIGSVILPARDEAQKEMNEYGEESSRYRGYASNEPWWSLQKDFYSDLADYYSMLAWFAERRYEKLKEKVELFDSINTATQNLFTQSGELRATARQGIASITKSFQNGVYMIDMNATWRISLSDINDKLLEQTKAEYMKENESGELEYDWDKIQELLEKDIDEVSDMEYLALVDMMSEMSKEELAIVISRGTIRGVLGDTTCYGIRNVLTEASNRYLILAQLDAEMTIFDQTCTNAYDEVEVTNYLSKAYFIRNVLSNIESNTGKKYVIQLSSEEQTGKLTYIADITYTSEVYANDGSVIIPFVDERTIKVYPWGEAAQAEIILENQVSTTITGLKPDIWSMVGKGVGTEALGYVIGKFGNGVTYHIAATNLLMDIKEGYERTLVIDGTIDTIEAGQYVDALDIKCGVVSVTGDGVSHAVLYNPQYSPESLMVGVEAYNSANPDDTIQPEELKKSVSNFGAGGEMLEKYVDWYYKKAGEIAITDYWGTLEKIVGEYREQNPGIIRADVRNLSVDQLQELINKKNDSSYEINMEVMKGSGSEK